MPAAHQEKFITKLIVGIPLITAGIFVILYASFEKGQKTDWYFWGILAAITTNAGIVLVGSAFVHKIKSDLIKKQKKREQQKGVTVE